MRLLLFCRPKDFVVLRRLASVLHRGLIATNVLRCRITARRPGSNQGSQAGAHLIAVKARMSKARHSSWGCQRTPTLRPDTGGRPNSPGPLPELERDGTTNQKTGQLGVSRNTTPLGVRFQFLSAALFPLLFYPSGRTASSVPTVGRSCSKTRRLSPFQQAGDPDENYCSYKRDQDGPYHSATLPDSQ